MCFDSYLRSPFKIIKNIYCLLEFLYVKENFVMPNGTQNFLTEQNYVLQLYIKILKYNVHSKH